MVPVVMVGSGPDGADGEEGKGEGWKGPSSEGEAAPLGDLPKEVGTRNELKHPPWKTETGQQEVSIRRSDSLCAVPRGIR